MLSDTSLSSLNEGNCGITCIVLSFGEAQVATKIAVNCTWLCTAALAGEAAEQHNGITLGVVVPKSWCQVSVAKPSTSSTNLDKNICISGCLRPNQRPATAQCLNRRAGSVIHRELHWPDRRFGLFLKGAAIGVESDGQGVLLQHFLVIKCFAKTATFDVLNVAFCPFSTQLPGVSLDLIFGL